MQMMRGLEDVLVAAHSAPSADNSQPWIFELEGDVLHLCWGGAAGAGPFGADSPATLLAIGGVIENLHAAAEHYGLGVDAIPVGTDGRARGVYFSAVFSESIEGGLSTDVCPVLLRHTNRFPFRSVVLSDLERELLSSGREGPARFEVFYRPLALREIARVVAAASRIRFRTREIHEWLASCLRYSPEQIARGDGLDIHALDLPPGGKGFLRLTSDWKLMQWLNRCGAYRVMAGVEASAIARGPTIAALIAPRDQDACIAAGRLMCRVWTALNSRGVAVHPYYVVADQLQRLREKAVPADLVHEARALERSAAGCFGLASGETLHMLLRIGYPTREPVRSLRRPLPCVTRVI